MKKSTLSLVNLVLVLLFGAITIYLLFADKNVTSISDSPDQNVGESVMLKIAYVNTDTLLNDYNMSKDLNEELMKHSEETRTSLNEKARKLESEMIEFRRKLDNNGFLSRERAENENARLVKAREDLEQLDQRMSNDMMQKQRDVSEKLLKTITAYLEKYNATHNYEMILSNTVGGNVLLAKEKYNITQEVLKALNEEYAAK